MVSFSPEKMEMAPSGGRETHLVQKAVQQVGWSLGDLETAILSLESSVKRGGSNTARCLQGPPSDKARWQKGRIFPRAKGTLCPWDCSSVYKNRWRGKTREKPSGWSGWIWGKRQIPAMVILENTGRIDPVHETRQGVDVGAPLHD